MIIAGLAKPLWYVVFLSSSCLAGDRPASCHYDIFSQYRFETFIECSIAGRSFRPGMTDARAVIGTCMRDDDPLYLKLIDGLGEGT